MLLQLMKLGGSDLVEEVVGTAAEASPSRALSIAAMKYELGFSDLAAVGEGPVWLEAD